MKKPTLATFFLLLGAATLLAQTNMRDFVVPYVASDQAVIEGMLTLAGVNENDILYDLGCGDGRIVIIAAQNFGARGVGIDINPVRIDESNANAERAGVTDRVEFRAGSFFDEDFSEATVIAMYLTEDINIRLRPYFFRDLKPGTRITTHDYGLGAWEADTTTTVSPAGGWGDQKVFFWVLPANVSGDWSFDTGDLPHLLHIDQVFQRLEGTMTVRDTARDIDGMTITGDRIHFVVNVPREGGTTSYVYDGIVAGDAISGTITSGDTRTAWEATRDPATAVELDPFPEDR